MVGTWRKVLGAGLAAAVLGAPIAEAQDVGQIIGMGAPLVMQMMRGAQTGERAKWPSAGVSGEIHSEEDKEIGQKKTARDPRSSQSRRRPKVRQKEKLEEQAASPERIIFPADLQLYVP